MSTPPELEAKIGAIGAAVDTGFAALNQAIVNETAQIQAAIAAAQAGDPAALDHASALLDALAATLQERLTTTQQAISAEVP